jgi:hypothetical protein
MLILDIRGRRDQNVGVDFSEELRDIDNCLNALKCCEPAWAASWGLLAYAIDDLFAQLDQRQSFHVSFHHVKNDWLASRSVFHRNMLVEQVSKNFTQNPPASVESLSPSNSASPAGYVADPSLVNVVFNAPVHFMPAADRIHHQSFGLMESSGMQEARVPMPPAFDDSMYSTQGSLSEILMKPLPDMEALESMATGFTDMWFNAPVGSECVVSPALVTRSDSSYR